MGGMVAAMEHWATRHVLRWVWRTTIGKPGGCVGLGSGGGARRGKKNSTFSLEHNLKFIPTLQEARVKLGEVENADIVC